MGGDRIGWLASPTIFTAAILALPLLSIAKRFLAFEDDRAGGLDLWIDMAVIALYLLWYGGARGVVKFMDTGSHSPGMITRGVRAGGSISPVTGSG
jgi:hypothetical protein